MFSPNYSKEGHAVVALFELVGLNPDRLLKSARIVIPLKVEGFAAVSALDGLNPDRPLRRAGMAK
jgi:hypothetical protein